jgi:predicted nuclease of predicted toxin-antitoxin system
MPLGLYLDAHVPRAIAIGLRLRGVDVLTAQDDGAADLPDPALLDRASLAQRLLFTFDSDLLAEATLRQREGTPFAGVAYAHPMRVSIGRCISELETIAQALESSDMANQVVFIPL